MWLGRKAGARHFGTAMVYLCVCLSFLNYPQSKGASRLHLSWNRSCNAIHIPGRKKVGEAKVALLIRSSRFQGFA